MRSRRKSCLCCEIAKGSRDQKPQKRIWSKMMKQYSGKVKKVNGEVFADNVDIPEMSENTVDVYAHLYDNPVDLELIVWFDLGGAYLHSEMHPDRHRVAEHMLTEFTRDVKMELVNRELKLEESELKKIVKDLNGLERDNGNLEEDIAKFELKIEEAKAEIASNKEVIESKKKEIEAQEKVVGDVQAQMENL